jgi:hypothetical protein
MKKRPQCSCLPVAVACRPGPDRAASKWWSFRRFHALRKRHREPTHVLSRQGLGQPTFAKESIRAAIRASDGR